MSGLTFTPHPEPALAALFDTSVVPCIDTVSEEGTGYPVRLIEGENVFALSRLIADGVRADVVYADLPYNTGDASGDSNAMSVLDYNDRRDSMDDFEHSGWLSFIAPRVRLIHALLRRTGVAIFAIGRDELAPLILLLEDIFGSRNRVSIVTWQGGAKSHSRFVSNSADYMIIMARDVNELKRRKVKWRTPREGAAELIAAAERIWDGHHGDRESAQEAWRSWLLRAGVAKEFSYYRYLDEHGRVYRTSDMGATVARSSRPRRPLVHPVTGMQCAVPAKGWAISDERMDWLLAEGRVFFGSDHTVIPKQVTYLDETRGILSDVVTRARGTAQIDLNAMIGSRADGSPRFYGPKSVDVLEQWISAVVPEFRIAEAETDPIIVVDPFAGSASTGEAVARIAARTGVRYEVACITTNENTDNADPEMGIARYVALPRLRAVLSGVWADGRAHVGVPGRLVYQRLAMRPGEDEEYRKVVDNVVSPNVARPTMMPA